MRWSWGGRRPSTCRGPSPNPSSWSLRRVYCPYLLINKKRYAGLLYTNPAAYDKMDSKARLHGLSRACMCVSRGRP